MYWRSADRVICSDVPAQRRRPGEVFRCAEVSRTGMMFRYHRRTADRAMCSDVPARQSRNDLFDILHGTSRDGLPIPGGYQPVVDEI
jgi:hypothetical protein